MILIWELIRHIGILGREGNKRYVYKQADNEFYYIEISECGFGSNGEFYGYKYKADETFYLITVINAIITVMLNLYLTWLQKSMVKKHVIL